MKNRRYTELICKRFCSFYKPGKERLKCGTYTFLQRNLSTGELTQVVKKTPSGYDFSEDATIKTLICRKCSFVADDCDFRASKIATTSQIGKGKGTVSPCGGYSIVAQLLKGVKDPF
jgi:hypothetical protein